MSRFNHWSKPHLLWAWHPCARTTFSGGSALSRRAQIKSPRRNNNEEWGQLSHTLCIWYMSYTIRAVSRWPLFLFNGDDSQKHNFTTPVISQPLCIFFSSFLCFSLAQENVQNCGGLRLQSGFCFPIILLLPSSKKPFMSPLLPFVWAACHKRCCPTIPPPPEQKPPFATIILVWNPSLLGANNKKKHPSCSLWLQTFSPLSAPWLHREHSHFSPRWSSSG